MLTPHPPKGGGIKGEDGMYQTKTLIQDFYF